jgi:transcriptional regulator with XRE-family HTH domain
MPPALYATVLARNLRAARAATEPQLSQADVGERMSALGFTTWLRQTMSIVEQGKRRVTAEEIAALAIVLGTTVSRLMTAVPPAEDGSQYFTFPAGPAIPERRLTWNDGSVRWDGNKPVPAPAPGPAEAAELDRFSARIRAVEEAGGEAAVAERRSD